jgi:biotin carboxylase
MKILVLAGGSDQIALITELQKRHHAVILLDYLYNPPAKEYADKHIIASTLDIDAVREAALLEKVDLVATACTDQALLTAAKVSEDLNLPSYISYQTALNVTNKAYMKKILLENNIPTAKYMITEKNMLENIDDFAFPLVVKPVDCNSSKGVEKVYKKESLKKSLEYALSLSRTKTAIVEEYKEGEEISADFYIEKGVVKLLLVTGSYKIPSRQSFTILQSRYPVVNENEEQELLQTAQKIVDAFKLDTAPLLVQFIKSNGVFYVLEFSARMGGGSKYKIIEILSGVNIMHVYADLILGINQTVHPEKKVNYALMNYVYCESGIIHEMRNFDTLKKARIMDEYFYCKTVGMEINRAESNTDRAAGFLITGNDKQDVASRLQIADKELKILDMAGKDIMIHGLYGY